MYVGIKDDIIVSVVVINNEFDDQYKNGDWECDNERFAVIHRLCVNPIYQNQKTGKNTIIMIEDLLQKEVIGDNAQFSPNISLYTAGHPIHPDSRNSGYEYGIGIAIGNNVWLGGNVVTKDIPDKKIINKM